MTRVLVVEDSPTQAELVRMVLAQAGFEVIVELDPKHALDALGSIRPDLVLSDVVMPVMSGYELCKKIKASGSIPVLLMTSLEDPAEILHALECGADGFILKTRSTRELPQRIKNLLTTRSERAAGAEGAVFFQGKKYDIGSGREQILDLLLSTFEDAVETNRALGESMAKLTSQHEALVRAERMKEQLSAAIVHDLKSPAAGLMMLARSRLKKAGLSDDERRNWSMVQATAETSQRMALNLLDIARREEGPLAASRSDVELAAMIGEVQSIVSVFAEDRRLRIEVSVDPAMKSAKIDRSLISRLLLNLADNAVRHTPSGGLLMIDAARGRDGALELRVINDGEPIPIASREKIFDRYARLDRAVDTGRGLGLWFCRIAVEAHGGTICVEDDPRAPTCFVARIPEA